MMKSTVAAIATATLLSTTATAEYGGKVIIIDGDININDVNELADCTKDAGGYGVMDRSVGVAPAKTAMVLFRPTAPDYPKCISKIKSEFGVEVTELNDTLAAECFPEKENEAGEFTPKMGANSSCPLTPGAECTAETQACEGKTKCNVEGKYCPWAPLEKLVKFTFKADKKNQVNPLQDTTYREFLNDVLNEINTKAEGCAIAEPRDDTAEWDAPGWKWVEVHNVVDRTKCKANAAKAAKDAVDAYNKDLADDKKLNVSVEVDDNFAFPTTCWNDKDDELNAAKEGCNNSILVRGGVACAADAQCGSKKCQDTKCAFAANNAVVAMVAPVLAAVLAVAFF